MTQLRHHKQKATYWPVTGSDGYGGFTFDPPQLLKVRWEENGELFIDANGEQVVSRATVFVGQDVSIGDYLALEDFTNEFDPGQVDSAFRIKQYMKNTDLRNIRIERKIFL